MSSLLCTEKNAFKCNFVFLCVKVRSEIVVFSLSAFLCLPFPFASHLPSLSPYAPN